MSAMTGVRLVTLALNVPGPVAVARLVAEGAVATKIEPPAGDPLAGYCPAWYEDLHRGVDVQTIDLRSSEGRAELDRHLAAAQVLVTSQRPSALARLGLGDAELAAQFPGLRRVEIVGDTAAPEVPGHDVTYQAEAGLVADALPRTLIADMAGAERVVSAVLFAMAGPAGGRRIVGLRDVVSDMAEPLRRGLTAHDGLLGGRLPAYGVYRVRDGVIAVAALEPHFRQRLYAALDLPLDAPLDQPAAARSCAEWRAVAAAHDLPIVAMTSAAW
jgi:crotonobetainyl-CoA:carnitine CoA-transferase CaiB-like acyl-CoA transferase